MKRSPIKRKAKASPTAHEKAHLCIIASLRCIICGRSPVNVHHIREGYGLSQRAPHIETLPLCPWHHQTGTFGEAFHAGPREWVARFGTERELLARLRQWFDDPMVPYPCIAREIQEREHQAQLLARHLQHVETFRQTWVTTFGSQKAQAAS